MVQPEGHGSETTASGPGAEELERYRKKLAEWRAMGFDVSALEVLLETDFEQFKQKRFELLRSQILEGRPPQTDRRASQEDARKADAPSQPARNSLFSHFAPFHGKGTTQQAAPPTRPAPSAIQQQPHHLAQTILSRPSAERPPPDQPHSEMRYPSVRRKREKRVRTFSVSAEPQGGGVGVIDLGGAPDRKATAPVRKVAALARKTAGPSQDGSEPSKTEDAGRAEGPEEEAGPEEETQGPAMEVGSVEGPLDEGPLTDGESSGEEPGPRKVVKRRKVVKKAPRSKSSAWIAAGVVVMLVLAGLGAWYFFAGPPRSLSARYWHPASAMAGENVIFDASNSSSSGSPMANYSWEFGDGGREYLKRTTHHYVEPGTYHVVLTVQNENGDTATRRSVLTITPLLVTVPAVSVGDKGNYNAYGSALVSNSDTSVYTIVYQGLSIHISQLQINFTGTQDQWARDILLKEDGFKNQHNALRTESSEYLQFSGTATTDTLGKVPINGVLDYNESSYADPASGGVFGLDLFARTTIKPVLGSEEKSSQDTLRTYPSVAGVIGQFRLEKIYSGHRFDQSDRSTLQGNLTGGGIAYFWNATGADNAGGKPSMGIHVTADTAALRSSGITEFYMDLFVSGASSMPTLTHAHVAGFSTGTSFVSDHYTEMTGFSAGSTPVDRTPQAFNADPLGAEMFSRPFRDVPAEGTGPTSLKFTPEEAVSEARSKNPDFANYLAANPQAYAVRGKYYEGPVPDTACWNISFAYPGAGTGRYINVTRDILHQFSVSSAWETPDRVTTQESNLSGLLTMGSAVAIFQNDSATAGDFFVGGTIQYSSGTTLSLQADGSYPAINLASMSASVQASRYAAILGKSERTASRTIDHTSAISMDTGQMMYYWTHTVG